jgi:tetratricopeptide (TPR) repeat protein
MANAEEQRTLRYSAFISYSHFDSAFAQRLHRRLENYRLPRRLTASRGTRTNDRRRLRPIFRDRDELTAAPDLSAAVQDAIADSSALIVVCSESSRQSDWVGREVALFRQCHGDRAILAVLSEDATTESFPPALRPDGPDEHAHLPLAADFRPDGDGRRLGLLKIVAVLAGVRLDELVQRDAQRRIRQVTLISGGAVVGMAVMGVLTLVALNARAVAERERTRGEKLIESILTDLRKRLEQVGRLDLMDAANTVALEYFRGQDLSRLSGAGLEQRAKLLQAIGADDEKRDNIGDARAQFEEAKRTTDALTASNSSDESRTFAQAQSEYWLGDIYWRIGDCSQAEVAFKGYAALARRLVEIAPNNPDWLMETGYADSNLGTFVMRRTIDLMRAKHHFETALNEFNSAAEKRPNDPDIQAEIADGYAWLGDIERLRGNCDGALKNRRVEQRILNQLLKRDPQNAEIRGGVIANELALARIDICRGGPALTQAMEKLEVGYRDARELARDENGNPEALKQVRVFELFKARTSMMMSIDMRPGDTEIAAALGDCNADGRLSHNEEIATFCAILKARRLAQTGESEKALKSLASLNGAGLPKCNKLTERWGLNFSEEVELASTAR